MTDPFAQFGGQEIKQPIAGGSDPFAQFGGTALPSEDPFAQFGGKKVEDIDPFAQFGGRREEDKSTGGDIVKGLMGGLKEALNPFNITPDEMNRDKSIAELGAQFVTQLGGGMAATAAAAGGLAALGVAAAPAALAAAAMYGIYSGLGYETARSRAEGKDFSPGRAALSVALEANPLVRSASKLNKLIRTGAQIAGQAGLEYAHSEDKQAAAIAGALGSLSMLGVNLSKPTSSLNTIPGPSKNVLKLNNDMIADPDLNIVNKAYAILEDMPQELPEKIPNAFKKFVVGNKVPDLDKAFDDATTNLGPKRLDELFYNYQFSKAQTKASQNMIKDIEKGLKTPVNDPLIPGLHLVQDPKFVAKEMDDKLGLELEDILDSLSEAESSYTNSIAPYVNKARELTKKAEKLKLDPEAIGKMLSGHTPVRGDVADVVEEWRGLYDAVRTDLVSHGYAIPYKENYMNMKSLSRPDMYNLMKIQIEKFDKIGAKLDKNPLELSADDFAKYGIKDTAVLIEELKDLKKVAGHVLGIEGEEMNNMNLFNKAMNDVLEPGQKVAKGFDVGARFQRKGEIPESFRTFDIGQNFLAYLGNNYKGVHYGSSLDRLERSIATMKAFGLEESVNYWSKFYKNMSGVESETVGRMGSLMNRMRANLRYTYQHDDEASKLLKFTAKQREAALDMSSWLSSMVYPNFLFNVKATLRNYTQTLAVTAPHFRGTFGAAIVKDGWKEMIKNVGGMEKFLQSKNITAASEAIRAGYKDLGDGLSRSELRNFTDKLNSTLMWTYSKSDVVNRFITYKAGQSWAKRLKAGDQDAIKALKVLGSATKSKLRRLDLANIDEEKLGDILGKHLVSTTQFHYGKTQMHQLGRDLGPLFSMFTKWPSMVGSEMVYNLRKHGIRKGGATVAWKYGMPLALLHLAQENRDALEGDNAELSAYVLGKDLKDVAPAMSIANIDIMGGPVQRLVLDTGRNVIKAAGDLGSDDSKAVETAFSQAYEALSAFSPVPFTPVVREAARFHESMGGKPMREYVKELMIE